jgi:hypothetical protein
LYCGQRLENERKPVARSNKRKNTVTKNSPCIVGSD